MLCGATPAIQIMVEMSDRMWSTGEGNGKPLQYSCLENPMNSMKRQKDGTLKDEIPRLEGAQYATRDQWRNNSRKNERMEPKQKQHPAMDVTGDRSKVRCCKEQYCIGTWNVRSMNQGKFSSVQFSHSVVSNSLWPHELQHARPPCLSQLPESTQTHVHWVGDAIQPAHPLSSPSPPALNLSQH